MIRQRLETDVRESKPLLNHGGNMIVNIDATKPPVVVLNTIITHMVDGRKSDLFVEN